MLNQKGKCQLISSGPAVLGCAGLAWLELGPIEIYCFMTLDCGVSGSRCRHSGHAGYCHNLSLEKMLLQPQADIRNHPRKAIQTDCKKSSVSMLTLLVKALPLLQQLCRVRRRWGGQCTMVTVAALSRPSQHTITQCTAAAQILLSYYCIILWSGVNMGNISPPAFNQLSKYQHKQSCQLVDSWVNNFPRK